jgi:general secretion pathway protein F
MPAYQFEAVDSQGQTLKGVMEGDTARAVRSSLRAQGHVPLLVQAIASGQAATPTSIWQTRLFDRGAFNGTQLAVWTRQLAGLVGSGLTLERALTALTEEAETERQQQTVAALRAEVNAGSSFARALEQHPKEFEPVYVAVIAAGESSGHLGQVLGRLADDLEERQVLRHKVIGAVIYPAIVSVFAVIIVAFLMTYVVPQVANVFAGSKRALPLLTTLMLGLSAFLRTWGWLLVAALVGGLLIWRQALKSPAFALRNDAFWLQVPVLGRLIRGYNATRFAGTLAMLAAAGVPILKALQAAADTLSNRAMKADALDALALVREGAPLAQALAQKKRFPGILPMFARLGEQTGTLPAMLERAATQLSQDVQRRAMALATIAEPVLIMGMGLLVMLIVLAVLLPIIQLNQWVR